MSTAALSRLLGGLAGVRREELSRFLPLTLAYGLVIGSLFVLKPARNALFLDQLGLAQLPYVLMLVALVGGVAAVVFSRFAAALRLDRLVLGTFVILIGCLLGFWAILAQGWTWGYYLFYVWVNLYGLMATSLMWLTANAVFNAREGRRLFGLIGTAGILGAILGGAFTSAIVTHLGTENLLLVCAGILVAVLALLFPLRTPGDLAEGTGRKRQEVGIVESLRRTKLLRLLGGMAAMAAVVAAIIDVQFNSIVDQVYPGIDAKTAFFGRFFAYLNVFAVLFQALVTPRILRSLGVIPALLFLPASMALGSVAVLFLPGVAAAVAVKVGDQAFRHSIQRSAAELLYLPIPPEVKKRTKVILDTAVDNLATGLGALLVLVAVSVIGVSYQHLSFISLVVVALWLAVVLRGRRAYVDAFRQAIERRDIDPSEYTVDIAEAATLDSLVKALDSQHEGRLTYALDMLAPVRAERLVEPTSLLLQHPSAEIRRRALQILQNQAGPGLPLDRVEGRLQDPELQVRIEALYCLCLHGEGDRLERLRAALESRDTRLRGAAIGCIAAYGTEQEDGLVSAASVRGLLADSPSLAERVQAVRIVGSLAHPELRAAARDSLLQLMNSSEPEVVRETIASLGQLADPEHVPWLMAKLDDWRYRSAARAALAAYGTGLIPVLRDRLMEAGLDTFSRARGVRVLADIPEQETVDTLLQCLPDADPQLQYGIIKSLSKIRSTHPELSFLRGQVVAALRETTEHHYHLLQAARLLGAPKDPESGQLLRRALEETQVQNRKRVFRLLGLLYSPRDMYNAYIGYVSGQQATRGSSLELLDNVLDRELKELLIPFLDPPTAADAHAHGERLFGSRLGSADRAGDFLLRCRDPWLRACATYSLGGTASLASRIDEMRHDPDQVVRETADLRVRQRLQAG